MTSIAIGEYEYTISANHKDQATTAISYTLKILVEDPSCSTATISVPTQTDPPNHTYSGPTFFTASYSASDTSCAIEYACVAPTSGIDLCAIGSLDTATGVFQLTTTDKVSYPPGTYTVEIKGSVASHPD